MGETSYQRTSVSVKTSVKNKQLKVEMPPPGSDLHITTNYIFVLYTVVIVTSLPARNFCGRRWKLLSDISIKFSSNLRWRLFIETF